MAGLYVHLPFCPYICPYCDFAKWPHRASQAERYLHALRAQSAGATDFSAATLFYGGGTPNTYAPPEIAALTVELRRRFELPGGAEVSIECNPEPELCEGFAAYRAAGITRISFGVQSFDARELETLGRRHRAADVVRAVGRARDAGFDNVSLDLIFGAPGQTLGTWSASLDAALALRPEHVSTYGLTVEAGTPYDGWFERDPGAFPSPDVQADLYALAIERLTGAGYEHYEISNFALPGYRCAHNENYWANGEYLGLGVGAASYVRGERRTNTRDLSVYLAAAEAGEAVPGESERLEGAARLGEATMLALRTEKGVDVASFAERYGIDFLTYYRGVLAEMDAAGMLEVGPARVALTRRGRFLANDVCSAFITLP